VNFAAQQTIREYLLGSLPSERQQELEERLLLDDDLYEELLIIEEELVDDFLDGTLSVAERESFQTHFAAAPEHQEKLRFATVFKKYIAEHPPLPATPTPKPRFLGFLPIQSPALRYAFATVLLVSVIGISWLAWKGWVRPAPRDPGSVLAVVLTPGVSRGEGEVARVVIPGDINTVRLQLRLTEGDFPTYEASLINSTRDAITTAEDLKTQKNDGQTTIAFEVPADRLPAGDYRVKLNGVDHDGNKQDVASYSFRVQTR